MSILKKLHEKSEIWFSVVWIVVYCVLMSMRKEKEGHR